MQFCILLPETNIWAKAFFDYIEWWQFNGVLCTHTHTLRILNSIDKYEHVSVVQISNGKKWVTARHQLLFTTVGNPAQTTLPALQSPRHVHQPRETEEKRRENLVDVHLTTYLRENVGGCKTDLLRLCSSLRGKWLWIRFQWRVTSGREIRSTDIRQWGDMFNGRFPRLRGGKKRITPDEI